MTAFFVVPVGALAVAASVWPTRRWPFTQRAVAIALAAAILFALPWLCPFSPIGFRAFVTLFSCALLPPKLLDFHFDTQIWNGRTWFEWLRHLLSPAGLVYRQHLKARTKTTVENLRLALRTLVQVLAGALLLWWATSAARNWPNFFVEHSVKILAAYLCIFDGAFLAIMTLFRLSGRGVMDLTRNPILARTPSDFWRRYNRDAGQVLRHHVYNHVGGDAHRIRAILTTFVLNGILHEYLFFIMSGRIVGLMMLFFVLQGLAVAFTFSCRLEGRRAFVGILLTLAFNWATSILFFRAIDLFTPWYQTWR
jgi:hypothetical protein